MALRVIVTTSDATAAAHVGGPVNVTHKTFDIEAPEVEAFMRESMNDFCNRVLVGVEVIDSAALKSTAAKEGGAA